MLDKPSTSSGVDNIGAYSMVNYSYAADVRRVDALIKTYKTGNVAVFSQVYQIFKCPKNVLFSTKSVIYMTVKR